MFTYSKTQSRPSKYVPKKQMLKVPAGTFLKVWWADSEPTVVLLLERMDPQQRGEVPLHCLHGSEQGFDRNWHVTNQQVLEVLHTITWPMPTLDLPKQN